jgi:putative membrane protein
MIVLIEYLRTFGWALVGALSMALAFVLMMKIFNILTPFNEWEEIKKGNIAVAITVASVIFSAAIVISQAIS